VIRLWAVLNCSVRRTGAAARRVGAGFQGPEVLWAGNREQEASGPGFEWNWLSARLFGMGGCPPRTALIVLGAMLYGLKPVPFNPLIGPLSVRLKRCPVTRQMPG
jgi:hypothetical protein